MSKNNSAWPIILVGVLVTSLLGGIGVWFANNPGLFDKLWIMIRYNPIFWLTGTMGVVGAVYFWRKNPEEFALGEAIVQAGVSMITVVMFFSLFSFQFTDVMDIEYWNSRVIMAEYWEAWTEHSTDSDGNSTTSYHPPSWALHTEAGEQVSISKMQYQRIAKRFGNSHYELIRSTGLNEGNRYYTNYNGKSGLEIPTAVEHYFVNWVKATKKASAESKALMETFRPLLLPYPKLEASPYGPIQLSRVLQAGTTISPVLIKDIDEGLDRLLSVIGSKKEINIFVYLVGTGRAEFGDALKEAWVNGKKNDVVLIIGLNNTKIEWTRVLAWVNAPSSGGADFKARLANRIKDLGSMDIDGETLVREINEQVMLPFEKGGYKRKSMADFDHLAGDVSVPWWANILVVLASAAVMLATGYAFHKGSLT
jgi:hypothetical protein